MSSVLSVFLLCHPGLVALLLMVAPSLLHLEPCVCALESGREEGTSTEGQGS